MVSKREEQILKLLTDGKERSATQIRETLKVKTVNSQLKNLTENNLVNKTKRNIFKYKITKKGLGLIKKQPVKPKGKLETYKQKSEEYDEINKEIDKRMGRIKNKSMKILDEDKYEDTGDGFDWYGETRAYVEFRDFDVRIALPDPYDDYAIDEYGDRNDIAYNDVNVNDKEVWGEVIKIGRERYEEDLEGLKKELKDVTEMLKKSKHVNMIYFEPSYELETGADVIYKKKKGSKVENDEMINKRKELYPYKKEYSEYESRVKTTKLIGGLLSDVLK